MPLNTQLALAININMTVKSISGFEKFKELKDFDHFLVSRKFCIVSMVHGGFLLKVFQMTSCKRRPDESACRVIPELTIAISIPPRLKLNDTHIHQVHIMCPKDQLPIGV